MRHLFVINPCSGKKTDPALVMQGIRDACAQAGIEPEIYAEFNRDGMVQFMRDAAESGDPVRIYACGGDGTLYCAVNATYGHRNVQIALVPYGSGNDFVRLFGEKELLRDISLHINGTPHWIDAIESGEDVSVNLVSMGFDAEVNDKQTQLKKLPLITGKAAYLLAILYCLPGKLFNRFTVTVDDGEPVTGDFMFAIGGNCRFYGGGFQPCPTAMPDDGLMDCVTVAREKSRLWMIMNINAYKRGEHFGDPGWPFAKLTRGKVMRVQTTRPAVVNIDGEARMGTDVTFTLREKAVCYVVPQGCSFFEKPPAVEPPASR
ncbi:MAG: hypothetical protein FWB76_01205 [Oscillospiraceae bacterium]|nr:hypothetical protein [Oscillospiraceae bacterium]